MSSAVHSNMFPSAVDGAPLVDTDTDPKPRAASGFPAAPIIGGRDAKADAQANDAKLREAGRTKVDRAIEYVRIAGPTGGAELAGLLDVVPKNVKATLNSALSDGRLKLDGGVWSIGTAKQAPRAAQKAAHRVTPTSAVAASLCVRDLQLLIWTSGAMTVRAADNVVELNAAQCSVLRTFLQLDAGLPGGGLKRTIPEPVLH